MDTSRKRWALSAHTAFESMIRIALIGCGSHSEVAHARPLAHYAARHAGEVDLVAACDLDIERARRFCRDHGFARAYSDMEEMLASEALDAVVSVVPMDRIG